MQHASGGCVYDELRMRCFHHVVCVCVGGSQEWKDSLEHHMMDSLRCEMEDRLCPSLRDGLKM